MKGGEVDKPLLEDVMPYRQFTAQEVDLLARLSGMEVRTAAHMFISPNTQKLSACMDVSASR
jgi:hypothetical protein